MSREHADCPDKGAPIAGTKTSISLAGQLRKTGKSMFSSVLRCAILAIGFSAVDRFFDLSVGSDFPGSLIRDDSQAQLKLAVGELGFRYIRFHAIFHDVLGTVRIQDGKPVYHWSRIDQPGESRASSGRDPIFGLSSRPASPRPSPNFRHSRTPLPVDQ
jgi:Glycosyl hydrolases family 39